MNKILKVSALSLFILSAPFAGSLAFAADEANVSPGLTYAGVPLGLHGSDPVALIENEKPTAGDPQFFASHNGVAYYFSNAENLEKFQANPDQFVPQNGGFCTLGVAYSKKLDGNPAYSAIVDGKLYVFINQAAQDVFTKDRAELISTADKVWPEIKNVKASEL